MANHHTFPWKEAFLEALRHMPVIKYACEAVGIARSTAWRARETDEGFAKAWDAAMEDGIDRAEQAAFKRAVDGWDEPLTHQGHISHVLEPYTDDKGEQRWRPKLDDNGQPIPVTVRKHSDALLSLVLKGRRKQVYADRTELTGAEGAPVAVDSTTRAARVAAILADAKARKDNSDLA